MRIHVQKTNSTLQTRSASRATPDSDFFVRPLAPRTKQGAQEGKAEGHKGDSTIPGATRFEHDFSRIPLYSGTSAEKREGQHNLIGYLGEKQHASAIAKINTNTLQNPNAETSEAPVLATSTESVEKETEATQLVEALPEQEETPAKVPVVKPLMIMRDKDIWWFDGENAKNYDEDATLTAGYPGATRGTFRWDVLDGASIVDFDNGSDGATKVNTNRIGIKSTGASGTTGDVRVRCSWSHGRMASTLYHTFTVRAPSAAVVVSGPTDTPVTRRKGCYGHPYCEPDDTCTSRGFNSTYALEVHDQFGTALPREVEVNEVFGVFVADFAGETWPFPITGSGMTGTPAQAQFTDTYGMMGCAGQYMPDPVHPSHPQAGTKVTHALQTIRAGSLAAGRGRPIKTHTVQYYRGKGR